MMDAWISSLMKSPRQLPAIDSLPRPLDDLTIIGTADYPPSKESRDASMWSLLLPLTDMFAEVVYLNHDKEEQTNDSLSGRESNVKQLASQLESWSQSLPAHLQHTASNLQHFAERGRLRDFSVMHLVYHHACQQLYFPFLNKRQMSSEALPVEVTTYAIRCKTHATALSELMWIGYATPNMEYLWSPLNGHLIVVASTVHMHTLIFDANEENINQAKQLLEQNYVLLLRLSEYWPTLGKSMSRLKALHRACASNSSVHTFEMNSWMASFLNRFDIAVGDRYGTTEDGMVMGTSAADVSSPTDVWGIITRDSALSWS